MTVPEAKRVVIPSVQKGHTTKQVSALDYTFFGDSILHGQRALLRFYFAKYNPDSCAACYYDKQQIRTNFEAMVRLGAVRGKCHTSVFVLDPLTRCQPDSVGQAYYFTDRVLPRLISESRCCHPENMFVVGDIDEDGIKEIGLYYSGCVSRYKTLLVYSLKKSHWQEIGHCVYDLGYAPATKPYSYFVRKEAKNKFKMLEITDLVSDKSKAGIRNWRHFSL